LRIIELAGPAARADSSSDKNRISYTRRSQMADLVRRCIDKSQILREQIPGVVPRLSIVTAKWLIVC